MKASIKYSQNFIKDINLVARLIEQSSITQDDLVLEIGAGSGVITSALVRQAKAVVAVEADTRLVGRLHEKFQNIANLTLVEGDFLLQSLPTEEYKVFANIPFNITADLVRKLIEAPNPPLDAYLFMQKEAAEKIGGKPISKDETQFSILSKPWFSYAVVHNFRKNDFQPAPAVDVVLLHIKKYPEPMIEESQSSLYRDFVIYAFNAKKPNLRKALELVLTYNQIKRLSKDLQFDLNSTPTQLTFNQWLGLFKYFTVGVIDAKKQLVIGAEAHLSKQQDKLQKIRRTRIAKDWNKLTP